MRRILTVFFLLLFLFAGSISVFADPHAVPDSTGQTVVTTVSTDLTL